MKDQSKKMKNDSLGRHVWQSIWYLSGRVVLPVFCFAACQPATVPLTSLPGSHKQLSQTNIGLNNKNIDQINTTGVNPESVSLVPPRSIIVIGEPEQIQNSGQDQSPKDIDIAQPLNKKMVNPETKAEIAAANAVMDSITWQYQAGEKETKTLDTVVPVGEGVNLTEDALEAAFALLSNRTNPSIDEPIFEMPPKLDGVVRVGLLVPLSGKYAALGIEIRRSVEMALFTFNNPKIELLFLDTKGGDGAGTAAMTGIENDVDIFIGPLFTDAVIQARAVTDYVANGQKKPPMLLLSNNVVNK